MDMDAGTRPALDTSTTVMRAILFTDVVASTEELERMGVAAWSRAIDHHRRSLEAVVNSAGGVVASFTGDGYMVAFDDVPAGVASAFRLQWAMWAQRELAFRIGVSAGAVLPMDDGNYLGLSVNCASRLCDACEPGEVLIEASAWVHAASDLALPRLEPVSLQARGFRETIGAFRAKPLTYGSLA